MQVRYSNQDPYTGGCKDPVVFLVGPTPRSLDVPSWRPEAIEILKDFDGLALVPEPSDGARWISYDYQVEWERDGLFHCSLIFAWVPREMRTMPALTTNVEFGYWLAKDPKKVVYGRPEGSPHTSYLDWLYRKETGRTPFSDLRTMLTGTLNDSLDKFGLASG